MTTIDIDCHRYYDMSFMQIINLEYESDQGDISYYQKK